uniref:Uncharacterized protein LOC101507704 n=1 Tax=Rhizophora mucronata TaxID=61149 RepID=A0A2P2KD20_RHIMU
MDNFNLQRKPITSYEEARGLFSISNTIGPVVCPKPRRVGILANSPIRPVWWQMRYVYRV